MSASGCGMTVTVARKPNRSYSFFIVHGDQIVTEEIAVHDSDDSGFDPFNLQGKG